MNHSLETIDRLAPRLRPQERVAGFQTWSDLLFVHWRVTAETIRNLLPPQVELDLFDGFAWIGLVPFHMSGVRPWWFPPIPGISEFHETNVRTYVVCNGEPGVWFFSLEAAQSLAVRVARWRWHLPYHRAEMSVVRQGTVRQYRSRRMWPPPLPAASEVVAEVGDWLSQNGPAGEAQSGTLEFFLTERYLLFTEISANQIARGQVHHRPYPLKEAKLLQCDQTLLDAASIHPHEPPAHTLFSPGVEVEIYPLRTAHG